jgi:hypothetical protein
MASIPAGSDRQHGLCPPSPEATSDGLGEKAVSTTQALPTTFCLTNDFNIVQIGGVEPSGPRYSCVFPHKITTFVLTR